MRRETEQVVTDSGCVCGRTSRCWQSHPVRQFTRSGNRCGWWNLALSVEFLDHHFTARDSEAPVLLLWDFVSAHWTEEVGKYAENINVFLLKVPPGLTSVYQPADVAWFGPLKCRIRGKWAQFGVQQSNDHDAKSDQAPFKLLPPSRSDAVS
uniref:AlNc14C14G1619 protein n=1 Tax=Albugo laibachii Nc14 TaxID=890382 RepID=F0W3V3_9STRA|nr:AlNc14C14G1619 [Albugo laibachii Nc14]|eukprot:CCA15702.1 AlNc14C14G1619 [Albugo laibachii Nc14]